MNAPAATKPSDFSISNVLWLTLLFAIPVGGMFGWLYVSAQKVEDIDYVRTLTGYLKRADVGYKLSPEFQDKDGDLVADTPTDPAKVIDPETLVFAPLSITESEAVWKEFLEHVQKVTGKKVAFQQAESPQLQVDGLHEGKLHITGFNTGYVPMAVNQGGFVPQCVMADDKGAFGYTMEFIVPAGSSLKSIKDLKGQVVMLTSPGSLSGFKAPMILMRDEHQLAPGKDYEFRLTGGHDESIKGIVEKKFAAAAVASDLLDRATARSSVPKDAYVSIYHSKRMPPGCFGCAHQLKPELVKKIGEAFSTFSWKGTGLGKEYEASHFEKFVPIKYKDDWQFVREIDEKLIKW